MGSFFCLNPSQIRNENLMRNVNLMRNANYYEMRKLLRSSKSIIKNHNHLN